VDFVPAGAGAGRNFGWQCFEGTFVRTTGGECSPPLSNHTPPALEYSRSGFAAAINGGFVVRDTTVPTLLGRYVYADSSNPDALGNAIFSARLSAGGNTENGSTGMSAPNALSFGEDACGHVYVSEGANVFRIQASAAAPACAPQQSPSAAVSTPLTGAQPVKEKRKCKKGKRRSKKTGKCRAKKRKRR
jgi:hypothetical protein